MNGKSDKRACLKNEKPKARPKLQLMSLSQLLKQEEQKE